MTQRKRNPANTVAETTKAAASGFIKPPPHIKLKKDERVYWDALARTRASNTWTEAELDLAANLSKDKAKVDQLRKEIEREGDIITNARGTPIPNPKHTLLETITRRVVTVSKLLHVHAAATQGRARDTGQRSKSANQTAEAVDQASLDSEGLIPRHH